MANDRTYDRQIAKGKTDMDVDAVEAERTARQAAHAQADQRDCGNEDYTPEEWAEWEQLQEKKISDAQEELNWLGQRKGGKGGKGWRPPKGKGKGKDKERLQTGKGKGDGCTWCWLPDHWQADCAALIKHKKGEDIK